MSTGYDYSWFVLTQSIIKKEFALSGSEQNPDLTGKSWLMTAKRATNKGAPAPVEAFKTHGADFVVRDNLADLVAGMNALSGDNLLKPEHLRIPDRGARPRDRQSLRQGQSGDEHPQCAPLYRRPVDPHRQAAPDSRSRPWALDRRQTQHPDPQDAGRLRDRPRLRAYSAIDGQIMPGLYAAGEAAGFGGGGMHGYRSLEGTFLGGCLFSGRNAGRAAAKAVG